MVYLIVRPLTVELFVGKYSTSRSTEGLPVSSGAGSRLAHFLAGQSRGGINAPSRASLIMTLFSYCRRCHYINIEWLIPVHLTTKLVG